MADFRHIIVGTPSRGHLTVTFVSTLLDLIVTGANRGWCVSWLPDGTSPCWTSRDRIINRVYKQTEATDLLFLDDDTGVDPSDVMTLLDSGEEVCGIAYRKRTPETKNHEYVLEVSDWAQVPKRGFIEADRLGAGAMLIRRSAMAKMFEAYAPTLTHETNVGPVVSLFRETVDPCFVSEDYSFCDRWRKIGGAVKVLLDARTEHQGAHKWCGNFADAWPIMAKAGREMMAKRAGDVPRADAVVPGVTE